jgi:hypothetical protein
MADHVQIRKNAMALSVQARRKALVNQIEALGYKKHCNSGCDAMNAMHEKVTSSIQEAKNNLNRDKLREAPLKL